MRIPVPLAWLFLVITFFTAGLLRQYHDRTPTSPYVNPVAGSLLFVSCFFLLLVSAREWRRGAVGGQGVRLGSITPIMLMLLIEKWVSLTLYEPLFAWLAPRDEPARLLDARFRGLAGVALILVCLLVGRFSIPTARKTWRRARPSRWPVGAAVTAAVVGGGYALLGGLAYLLGGVFRLRWPDADALLWSVLWSQAVLAFAEEVYYRGLLLSEMERLAPRLGLRNPLGRRWAALLFTAGLFSLEHVRADSPTGEAPRYLVFTLALGLLLGLLVMVSANLHLTAGVHVWINWVVLGAAPVFVDEAGEPALPAGTYIGVTLILAFAMVYLQQRLRRRRHGLPTKL
ncbi:MAG TPA: CPBP family glutamic-type intramembrane protease [Candidatus Polarisedimenticolaceae bacterium]|nr:CPBP family glutamic-type intramembrane protease [Candidatus Polarisedimenticolaceae bacterium]